MPPTFPAWFPYSPAIIPGIARFIGMMMVMNTVSLLLLLLLVLMWLIDYY